MRGDRACKLIEDRLFQKELFFLYILAKQFISLPECNNLKFLPGRIRKQAGQGLVSITIYPL